MRTQMSAGGSLLGSNLVGGFVACLTTTGAVAVDGALEDAAATAGSMGKLVSVDFSRLAQPVSAMARRVKPVH